jgi:hypothetical protein
LTPSASMSRAVQPRDDGHGGRAGMTVKSRWSRGSDLVEISPSRKIRGAAGPGAFGGYARVISEGRETPAA